MSRRYRRYIHNGIEFRSGLEVAVVKLLTGQGISYQYENMRIPYFVKARGAVCRACASHDVVVKRDYTPDLYLPDTGIIIEVKGLFSAKDRKKHKAVKEQQPEHDIRMWFSQDKKLHPNTDKRYSTWCEEHGLLYHIGIKGLPEWLTTT